MTDTCTTNPELATLREQINQVNDEMLALFERRMEISAKIAQAKRAAGKPVFDPARERAILTKVRRDAAEGMESYATMLFSLLMEMSSGYQQRLLNPASELTSRIEAALETTPRLFPPSATVACQGVEGAYSQQACEKIFKHPSITYYQSFEGVFKAIEAGECAYGVLPLENSTAGTVQTVYDLMMEHDFHIVRTCRFRVEHDLLALPGASVGSIKEIFSHEQAISQCTKFLETLPGVKVTAVANTAVAARMVAESGRTDVAALSSHTCAELYGLVVLARQVNDASNNTTRFACISKDLQIFPGADRASFMLVTPHVPGSLYKILARLYAFDVNMTKLESRPIPNRDFDYMFYFDIESSVYSPEFAALMSELDALCAEFTYLGSYNELV